MAEMRRSGAGRGRLWRAILLAAALLAAPVAARALPVEDFHARVQRAAVRVAEIYAIEEEEEEGAPDAAIAEVRQLLPPREVVETPDGPVEVDNTWLAVALDAYASSGDPEERVELLDRVTARLDALDRHLDALDERPGHATPEERERLGRILSGPEFRDPADGPFATLMRDLREQLAILLEKLLEALFGSGRGEAFGVGVRVLVGALGAAALALLIRAVAQAVAGRRRGGARRETRKVLGEEIDETTTAAELVASARALAARGEHRDAVRKLFVALLYQLDERGLVRLHADATNREYLALVRGLGRLHPVMSAMTDTFDRVWYGKAAADRALYEDFERQHAEASLALEEAKGRV